MEGVAGRWRQYRRAKVALHLRKKTQQRGAAESNLKHFTTILTLVFRCLSANARRFRSFLPSTHAIATFLTNRVVRRALLRQCLLPLLIELLQLLPLFVLNAAN